MDLNEYFYVLTIGWDTDDGYRYATCRGVYDVASGEEVIDIFFRLQKDLAEEHDAPVLRVHVHTWVFQPNAGLHRG